MQPEAVPQPPQGLGRLGRAGQGVELLQELGQVRPRGRVVHRPKGGADEVVVGEGHRATLAVGQLGRLGQQPPGQPVVAPLGVAAGEGAVGAAQVAEPQEPLQGVVGALLAAQAGVRGQGPGLVAPAGGVGDGVDHAVDDHRPDLVREHVGVGGADGGPVGVADVGHLAVADRPAQQVHVAGHVGRGHVVKDRPAPFGAGPGVGPVGLDPDPLLGPGEREGERRQRGQGVVGGLEALQRGAAGDPTGVETDQVEAGPDLVGVEVGPIAWRKPTPEPPGPPGLKKIDPMRRPGPVAGSLVRARLIVAPQGRS